MLLDHDLDALLKKIDQLIELAAEIDLELEQFKIPDYRRKRVLEIVWEE